MLNEMMRSWRFAAKCLGAFSLVFATSVSAQSDASIPHITGWIETDPATGYLAGDICIAATPSALGGSILLHRGLNVRGVRNAVTGAPLSFDGYYDARNIGDATPYEVAQGAADQGVCVSYVGAFPVVHVDAGERTTDDWKGNIAFDGKTVRAAEQTRFYPTLRDAAGVEHQQVTYDVEVRCTGCKTIFWNGSAPVAGDRARFTSDRPRLLMLYAGDLPFSTIDGVHFVGAEVSADAAAFVGTSFAAIARIHEDYLGVAMEDHPSLLSFAALGGRASRKLGVNTWGFATWPTIASDGRLPFDKLAPRGADGSLAAGSQRYFAHEMAHHYFGVRYAPRGPLRWFMLESTAEYLAARAIRTLRGEAAYQGLLAGYVRNSPTAVIPLDQVTDVGQIDGDYRYALGPLLLAALERRIGEEPLRRALTSFITNPPSQEVDYSYLRARLIAAGATEASLAVFEKACLKPTLDDACKAEAGIGS